MGDERDGELTPGTAETVPSPLSNRRSESGGDGPGAGARIGRFTVRDRLGEGGMGVVLLGVDPELEREVAIKLLRPDREEGELAEGRRLLREARAMAKLRHPNVVAVHEVGTTDGQTFVAMEYVRGRTLRDELEALEDGPERWRRVVDLFVHAGRGLEAAHAAGLVHRDFKPENVLVGEDGRVQVTDFGLVGIDDGEPGARSEAAVQELDSLSQTEHLTRTGAVIGTPLFMSPEQHVGQPADARSDQFAFCVALYVGLFRRYPFHGRNVVQYGLSVLSGEVEPMPRDADVPPWLFAVLRRGLSVAPEDRYASMSALLDELDLDPNSHRRGARARALLAGLVAGAWVAGPLLVEGFTTWVRPLGHEDVILSGLPSLLLLLVLARWAGRRFLQTEFNRALLGAVVVVHVVQAGLGVAGMLLGLSAATVYLLYPLLWCHAGGGVAAMLDRRLWPPAAAYLVVFLFAAWQPGYVNWFMVAGHIVLVGTIVTVWRPAER